VPAGLDLIRRVVRAGWRPAVLRLYDATEAARTFSEWTPGDAALLLVVCEGPAALVDAELQAIEAIAGDAPRLGAAPVAHWLDHRNTVPSWDFFLDRELMVDTIEIAATWDRIGELYDTVLAALRAVPGMIVASAHSSHSYAQGTNLYVTFVLKPEDFSRAEDIYLQAWSSVMEATLAARGTIAHHHGIGRLRVPWLERELGDAYPVLRAIKRALDPAGIMNPGTLLAIK
jgi:alkyldihydroxyacetonephosphate synthase